MRGWCVSKRRSTVCVDISCAFLHSEISLETVFSLSFLCLSADLLLPLESNLPLRKLLLRAICRPSRAQEEEKEEKKKTRTSTSLSQGEDGEDKKISSQDSEGPPKTETTSSSPTTKEEEEERQRLSAFLLTCVFHSASEEEERKKSEQRKNNKNAEAGGIEGSWHAVEMKNLQSICRAAIGKDPLTPENERLLWLR